MDLLCFHKSAGPEVFAQSEGKEEKIVAAKAAVVTYLQIFEKVIPANTKFLAWDSVSVYDFVLAGFFTNWVLNAQNAN